jgi:ligand-binding sensor domain-containing protein
MRTIYTLLLFSILAGDASAQAVYSEVFDLEKGLPTSEIQAIHQDELGYLWLATPSGLLRYDGYIFHHYTTADGLAGNDIRQIYEDKKNRFWLLSAASGLTIWQNSTFAPHRLSKSLQTLAKGREVASFDIDAGDTLWVSLRQQPPFAPDYRLYFAAEKDSIWQVYDSINLQANAPFSAVYLYNIPKSLLREPKPFLLGAAAENKIAARAIGLNLATTKADFLQLSNSGDCHCAWHKANLYCINQKYWAVFSRLGELVQADSFQQESLPIIQNFYIDQKGQAWAATAKGAYMWANPKLADAPSRYFAGYDVRQVRQDREGNYWLATWGDGLIFMPYLHIQVQAVSPYAHQNHILSLLYSPPFVQALSSVGMVYKLSPQTVLPTYYNQSATAARAWYQDKERQQIHIGNGKSIEEATGNAAWAWWKPEAGEINARAFAALDKNTLFVAANFGFMRVDMLTHQNQWQSSQIGFNQLVNDILVWTKDSIYLATAAGLYLYIPAAQTINLADTSQAASAPIRQLHRFGNTLILATDGAGIWYKDIDKAANHWAQISISTGLSSNFVRKVLAKNNNIWWVATNRGLDKIVWPSAANLTKPKEIINYSHRNGLPNSSINDILATDEGRLWLATDAGIVSFMPQQLEQAAAQKAPPVHISHIAVNGQERLLSDTLSMDYWQNNIQIQYLGIHFRERGRLLYRYRLDGLDTAWIESHERSIQYTNLPAGDYVFWVSTQANDGSWHPNPAKIQFSIRQPFWKTNIFLAAVAGGIFLFFLLFIWQFRRRSRIQRQLWASKQNALHAQMNPHFIFNAMNSILYFVRQNDKRQATAFLASFSSLIRRILDNSKRSLISLSEEIDTLQRYLELEKLRLSNPTDNFKIEVSPDINTETWQLPPMLIQPLIENSIMHGLLPKTEGERRLLVSMQVVRKKLCVTVEDNGIGRKAAGEIRSRRNITHTSYGAENITQRLKLLNQIYKKSISIEIQDLFDADNIAAGTKIIVWIPLGL